MRYSLRIPSTYTPKYNMKGAIFETMLNDILKIKMDQGTSREE
jgi:hypothetical protein